MDRDTIICPHFGSLVPLANIARGPGDHGIFVCPVCHIESRVGALAKLEGLVE